MEEKKTTGKNNELLTNSQLRMAAATVFGVMGGVAAAKIVEPKPQPDPKPGEKDDDEHHDDEDAKTVQHEHTTSHSTAHHTTSHTTTYNDNSQHYQQTVINNPGNTPEPGPTPPPTPEHTYHVDRVIQVGQVEVEGQPVNCALAVVDGHAAILLDSDNNGEADIMIIDRNDDGNIDENTEMMQVNSTNLSMSNMQVLASNVETDNPNNYIEAEHVQVLGYDHTQTEDGQDMDIAVVNYDGHRGLYADTNHDNIADVRWVDLNDNHAMDDNEITDLHQQGIEVHMDTMAQQVGYTGHGPADSQGMTLASTNAQGEVGLVEHHTGGSQMPDYINTADVSVVSSPAPDTNMQTAQLDGTPCEMEPMDTMDATLDDPTAGMDTFNV